MEALAAEVVTETVAVSATVWIAIISVVSIIATGLMTIGIKVISDKGLINAQKALYETQKKEKDDERERARQDRAEERAIANEVANRLLEQQRIAAEKAIEAVELAKALTKQVDGLLVDRDKAKVQEGEHKGKLAGEDTARTLAEGRELGRAEALSHSSSPQSNSADTLEGISAAAARAAAIAAPAAAAIAAPPAAAIAAPPAADVAAPPVVDKVVPPAVENAVKAAFEKEKLSAAENQAQPEKKKPAE